jgi:polar amino acid transport system substrate-binding protein
VAAGLFYLLLTVPLTHLVNFIDNRLRRGRKPGEDDPLELPTSQEMI